MEVSLTSQGSGPGFYWTGMHDICMSLSNQATRHLPEDFAHVKQDFLKCVAMVVFKHKIPREFLVNFD